MEVGYAGTNIGVCRYSPTTGAIDDCLNVYDGMPNWATYAVGANSTTVFGGTFSGVGLIDKVQPRSTMSGNQRRQLRMLLSKSSTILRTSD